MITDTPRGVIIAVRVIPRAARSALAGTRDGALLVRLNAPPVDGAANGELIDLIAGTLGISKRAVTVASGQKSRRKTVRVEGVSAADVLAKLTP